MKILIAYYSRTGTTKKVAEAIAEKMGAEVEEIRDTVDRSGAKGYLISGRDAMKKSLTKLEPLKLDPAGYDLVVVGTPVWVGNVSTPVRTYLAENKDKFKKVAFFCTLGGSGDKKTFAEMEKVIGQKPAGTLALKTQEVAENDFEKQAGDFVDKIIAAI
jgi:flavodoxin